LENEGGISRTWAPSFLFPALVEFTLGESYLFVCRGYDFWKQGELRLSGYYCYIIMISESL
jgi:hypothetical protein